MRNILLLVLMIILTTTASAQENYNNLWEDVQEHERNALPKSALNVVDRIYEKAKQSNNAPQLVKTLLYKSKFMTVLEEEAQLNIVNQFKQHISALESPAKNVLENILANLYWQYFNNHRWQFYNRTKTADKVDENDFRTWDLHTIFTEIHTHYQSSLGSLKVLQNIEIAAFDAIVNSVKESKLYRPTLYDFLAHNALEFYKTPEHSITKPKDQFKIDDERFLADARSFSKLTITTKEELSLQYHALKIYQNLIKQHLTTKNRNALVDVDIERLHFVNQYGTFNNKTEVLLETLKTSAKDYKDALSGLYNYEIAKIYNQQAERYQSDKNKAFQFKNKEALRICKSVISTYPKSLAAKKSQHLQSNIEQEQLQITNEQFVPIQKHSRVLVHYKNLNQLNFSIYKIDVDGIEAFNKMYKNTEKIAFINKLKQTNNWTVNLRNEKDYFNHNTEVVLPKLNQGMYLIVASNKERLSTNTMFGTSYIQITDLALVENHLNGIYTYQVLNRSNGAPVKGATLELKNKPQRYGKTIKKTLVTDDKGFAVFKSDNQYQKVLVRVSSKEDKAVFGDFYLYKHKVSVVKNFGNDRINVKPFVFTDRSIYRPGQTVYFKTIVLQQTGETSKILADESIKVLLNDVNGQVVKTLELKLNSFGSASGEFILPNNGLTGEYTIKIHKSGNSTFYANSKVRFHQYTTARISVEEYKRPTFKAVFNPVKETYKLNDNVIINGFAKSFAGINISEAKVVYRVHRKVQYPRWCYWYRPFITSEPQEIIQGETQTDDKGEFTIQFKALPDDSVSKDDLPIFTYEVTADITDINGETRSETAIVKVGYHSLLVNLNMLSELDKREKEHTITITTKNLNDEFVPSKGTLKLYKLQAPKHAVRKRPWMAPDYQDIPEDEFRKLFPHESYTAEEGNEDTWKKGAEVYSTPFNTGSSKEIIIKNIKSWTSGKYLAHVETTDKFGNAVKDEFRFKVFSPLDKTVADNKLFTISTDKNAYNLGDNVQLTIGSGSKDLYVVIQEERQHKIENTRIIRLSDEIKTLKIPLKNTDKDGFAILYHFVGYNAFESGHRIITVDKQEESPISIETKTFRDKLQPGSNQTWSFTIKNDKNNNIAAEVLASMYDASLDEFKPHNWAFNPKLETRSYYPRFKYYARQSFDNRFFKVVNINREKSTFPYQQYDQLNWFGFSFFNNRRRMLKLGAMNTMMKSAEMPGIVAETVVGDALDGKVAGLAADDMEEEVSIKGSNTITKDVLYVVDGELVASYDINNSDVVDLKIIKGAEATALYGNRAKNGVVIITTKSGQAKLNEDLAAVKTRTNLQETAFFYPQLTTDKKGNVSFSFTAPEALTQWKLQVLAHSKQLEYALTTLTSITQKDLMVTPNAPRFLREGDRIDLSAKISNLSKTALKGVAQLRLIDAITGKDVTQEITQNNTIDFSVAAKGNSNVSWNLVIPSSLQAVEYKIVAKAGNFSDGEQNVLPILSNRMLVTETLPMWLKSNETKMFELEKLVTSGKGSESLKHHKLTLEFTSNPAWYAIQALPYLMESTYECSEQIFSRYYANTLASFIVNSNPRIKEVFKQWTSSDALLSNLEKNEELKTLIIQETPWLRDAQSETDQKKRIALLFDLNTMTNQQQKALVTLKAMQLDNGGFSWFKGSNYPNRHITNHIIAGFGHLQKLGVIVNNSSIDDLIRKAMTYLDNEMIYQYEELLKSAEKIKSKKGEKASVEFLNSNHLNYQAIQYLYTRSFFPNISKRNKAKKAILYYQDQASKYWKEKGLYAKGQIALSLFRSGNIKTSKDILKSLRETSITNDELGMYWKSNTAGWFWYQAPIETQALLIETFSEIDNDITTIDHLKMWLLKHKQTNRWQTTKATTEAVYALLLQGSDWISITDMVTINIGGEKLNPVELDDVGIEAGTGYFKTSWNTTDISPKMGKVTIVKKEKGIAWGALYWQYFEDLEKMTSATTPLQLKKRLFKKLNGKTGKELVDIKEGDLKIGDLVTVRIELRADRDMDFVHMKDMRAAAFEPVNVLSQYKWQDGLGYYESTKDATTNFFFERLSKGVYVFEYDIRVNNSGDFSNGITTIQSMYAPEFSSHSKGTRIKIN